MAFLSEEKCLSRKEGTENENESIRKMPITTLLLME
jgi:hypothetical protein